MSVTPFDAAIDVLNRGRSLLELENETTSLLIREDLRRAALAFGVAALDTYLHWEIRRVKLRSPLPNKLAELDVPFGDLLEMGEHSVGARNKGVSDRPVTRVRNVLNERILKMTFQSHREVERALAMMGVRGPWSRLSKAITPNIPPHELKQKLDDLSHRRNKIVHEGDLRRLLRPHNITRQAITLEAVREDLDWIESFISALTAVID